MASMFEPGEPSFLISQRVIDTLLERASTAENEGKHDLAEKYLAWATIAEEKREDWFKKHPQDRAKEKA